MEKRNGVKWMKGVRRMNSKEKKKGKGLENGEEKE